MAFDNYSIVAEVAYILEKLPNNFAIWLSIIISFTAGILALYHSFGMEGSSVGEILRPLGAGLIVFMLGSVATVISWADPVFQKLMHDLLFLSASIMMIIGVIRIKSLSS